jgi:glucose-1-phosphate thymidylyltransferase
MKGILLAGGSGTRLAPLTDAVSKQLLPVYDKPVIHYPLATLMMAGVREVVVISTPRDLPLIQSLLGTGEQLGMKFIYREQAKPEGIAQAFHLAENDLKGSPVCLVLGDNLFYGHDLPVKLRNASKTSTGANVFASHVSDPERYGVVEFDKSWKALSVEEKPKVPKSNWAITGLYFYDDKVFEYARQIKPSARGELEITDVNRIYLEKGQLQVTTLGRGFAWLDTGTFDSLLQASHFVQTIEARQGTKICCIEEIAYTEGFIDHKQLMNLAEKYSKSGYGEYLRKISADPSAN